MKHKGTTNQKVANSKLGQQKHEEYLRKYLEAPKKCKKCDNQISYEKRRNIFCSRSCSVAFTNLGTTRHVNPNKVIVNCCVCGVSTKNKKFCSYECNYKFMWDEKKKLIETNGTLLPTGSGYGYNPNQSKRYLSEKRGYKCEICGNSQWQGQPIPLVLDHINGDPENHSLSNVRLICGNCNMQLPTFAGRNRGKGRKNRGWIDKKHL